MPHQHSDSARAPRHPAAHAATRRPLPLDPDVETPQRLSTPARVGAMVREARRVVVRRRSVLAVISAGGALGAVCRWEVGRLLPTSSGDFPWSTFWVNVSGAFALGVLMVLVTDLLPPSRHLRPFVGVGFLGGYTTFSTYALETRGLLVAGHPGAAAAYLLGTLVAGLLATWLAIVVARAGVVGARRRARRRHTRQEGSR